MTSAKHDPLLAALIAKLPVQTEQWPRAERVAELIKAPLCGVAVGKVEPRGHHYAQWRGPAKRWCVIGPTGTMVREGIFAKEEADRDVTTRNMPTSMAFVSHPRM